jgi:hypothetical protein
MTATKAAIDNRDCTCHPDDKPPRPCPKKFALRECRTAHLIAAALRLDSCASEFDGDLKYCAEYFDAFWDACTAYRRLPDVAEAASVPADREKLAQELVIIANSQICVNSDRTNLREAAAALRAPVPADVGATGYADNLAQIFAHNLAQKAQWIREAQDAPEGSSTDHINIGDIDADELEDAGAMLLRLATTKTWRPIAEAPKDGTLIIATNGTQVGICKWLDRHQSGYPHHDWFHVLLNGNAYRPTHWMPLPAPPTSPDSLAKAEEQ